MAVIKYEICTVNNFIEKVIKFWLFHIKETKSETIKTKTCPSVSLFMCIANEKTFQS